MGLSPPEYLSQPDQTRSNPRFSNGAHIYEVIPGARRVDLQRAIVNNRESDARPAASSELARRS